jgi:tetratricopeptide (TPR) repeat protein
MYIKSCITSALKRMLISLHSIRTSQAGRYVCSKVDMSDFKNQVKAGWAAYRKKDYSTALELFEKDLQKNGDRLHILGSIAFCYNKKNVLDKSIHYCERALNIDPNYYFAFQILSEVHAKKSENSEAYDYIQKAMNHRPTLPKFPDFLTRILQGLRLAHLKDIWDEPEDSEWLSWAQQFKESYELNDKNT